MVFIVFVLYAEIVLVLFLRYFWRAVRRNNPDFRLNFRIIDLWSASLCISPTIALLATLAQRDPRTILWAVLAGSLLVPYQLGGILCTYLNEDRARVRAGRSGASAFLSVVIGTLAGWIGLVLVACVTALALFTLAILISTIPYSLMLIPIYLFWRNRTR